MELKDTVSLMLSEDYRERFKAEFYQLQIRYEKLRAMIEKWDNFELMYIPECSREYIDVQLRAMEEYLDAMFDMAGEMNIEL